MKIPKPSELQEITRKSTKKLLLEKDKHVIDQIKNRASRGYYNLNIECFKVSSRLQEKLLSVGYTIKKSPHYGGHYEISWSQLT